MKWNNAALAAVPLTPLAVTNCWEEREQKKRLTRQLRLVGKEGQKGGSTTIPMGKGQKAKQPGRQGSDEGRPWRMTHTNSRTTATAACEQDARQAPELRRGEKGKAVAARRG